MTVEDWWKISVETSLFDRTACDQQILIEINKVISSTSWWDVCDDAGVYPWDEKINLSWSENFQRQKFLVYSKHVTY